MRKARLTGAAIAAALVATIGIQAHNPPQAAAWTTQIGTMPTATGSVTCWQGTVAYDAPSNSNFQYWCYRYDTNGNQLDNSFYARVWRAQCDTAQMVYGGNGNSWLDIWNGTNDGPAEILDSHGHRGSCQRGNWQSWTQGIGTTYPDATAVRHGTLLTNGNASQQDVCGGPTGNWQCPGVGYNLRIWLW